MQDRIIVTVLVCYITDQGSIIMIPYYRIRDIMTCILKKWCDNNYRYGTVVCSITSTSILLSTITAQLAIIMH